MQNNYFLTKEIFFDSTFTQMLTKKIPYNESYLRDNIKLLSPMNLSAVIIFENLDILKIIHELSPELIDEYILAFAVQCNSIKIVEFLLNCDIKYNRMFFNGVLEFCKKFGFTEIYDLFMKSKSHVECQKCDLLNNVTKFFDIDYTKIESIEDINRRLTSANQILEKICEDYFSYSKSKETQLHTCEYYNREDFEKTLGYLRYCTICGDDRKESSTEYESSENSYLESDPEQGSESGSESESGSLPCISSDRCYPKCPYCIDEIKSKASKLKSKCSSGDKKLKSIKKSSCASSKDQIKCSCDSSKCSSSDCKCDNKTE